VRPPTQLAAKYGLVVRSGRKHYRVETPEGVLIAVAPFGNRQRDRGPLTPERFMERQIVQGLRRLEGGQ
jgi:hypothetical protein